MEIEEKREKQIWAGSGGEEGAMEKKPGLLSRFKNRVAVAQRLAESLQTWIELGTVVKTRAIMSARKATSAKARVSVLSCISS